MFVYGILPLLVILLSSYPVDPACSPVREGHSTTLSCNVDTAGCSTSSATLLTWYAGSGSQEAARCTNSQGCFGFDSSISATLSPTGRSTLTVTRVSRTNPFNMETKWTCQPCARSQSSRSTACEKLEVYTPPESPSCTVSEDTDSGDIKSVNVSCSTSKVYPKARCKLYREKDGGNSVEIPTNPVYSHTETGETPVYYRSQCSFIVSVQELGEGTHRFTGYIHPGVTGDPAKVTGTRADKTVTLSFSQASHSCRSQAVQGYYLEESTTCTCSLISDGHPRGMAQWYKRDQLVGSGGTLVVSRDKSNPEQIYTCEAVSHLGRKVGSTLTAKFAYVPQVTFTLNPAQTTFSKGDNLELKCSGQGNPGPTLTLTTKRETTEDLRNVQAKELNHTLTLGCMDTGVYVCSGENNRGTNRTEISIGVRCPQQLRPLFNSKPQVEVAIRETAKLGIEIYGFPEPSTLTLQKTDDDTNLTSSPRHSVEYSASVSPFGVVNVTISDVMEADYTNYTLTVDNGVGNALNYTFYLNEVNATKVESSGDDNDIYIIVGICVGLAVLILVAVAVVLLYRRKNKSGKSAENGSILKEPEYVEKTNEVYGASNDVKSKAENGDVFRKSDIDLKQNPVYVSSREAQAENGVAQRESDCVMKENIVYGTSSEAQDGDRNEVIHKNPVYGSPFPYPGRKGTVKQSRDYTQLEPTITSASAAPANMKMAPPENDADPYEDVGNVKKSKSLGKSKQSVAPKPSSRDMAPQKPGSSRTFQVQQVGSSDELYAMVSLTNKGNKRTATPEPDEEEQDKDFLPDPSTRPDVPVKQFEEGDAHARGSDIPEQPYGNFQSVQAETSESDKSHTNGSFLPDETEDNVYANTGAVGMRS